MKWLKRILFAVVALVTLVALMIAFENWRGKRAWLKFKTEWESKGESFDIASVIPPKVSDQENFAMTPFFAPLFDYEYAPSVMHKNSNAVLRTRAVFLGSKRTCPNSACAMAQSGRISTGGRITSPGTPIIHYESGRNPRQPTSSRGSRSMTT